MRKPFKLRKVVEEFQEEARGYPGVFLTKQRLECGHVVYKRHLSSTVEKIAAAFRLIERKPERRRCWRCAEVK